MVAVLCSHTIQMHFCVVFVSQFSDPRYHCFRHQLHEKFDLISVNALRYFRIVHRRTLGLAISLPSLPFKVPSLSATLPSSNPRLQSRGDRQLDDTGRLGIAGVPRTPNKGLKRARFVAIDSRSCPRPVPGTTKSRPTPADRLDDRPECRKEGPPLPLPGWSPRFHNRVRLGLFIPSLTEQLSVVCTLFSERLVQYALPSRNSACAAATWLPPWSVRMPFLLSAEPSLHPPRPPPLRCEEWGDSRSICRLPRISGAPYLICIVSGRSRVISANERQPPGVTKSALASGYIVYGPGQGCQLRTVHLRRA